MVADAVHRSSASWLNVRSQSMRLVTPKPSLFCQNAVSRKLSGLYNELAQ